MITGFNTDIQHGGVTYHVQTEDKGLETPLILSLVYVGGAIIASKRSRYEDLIESGFDEQALTERLQRQHKLICAAIKQGRVDDLKKMAEPPPKRDTAKLKEATKPDEKPRPDAPPAREARPEQAEQAKADKPPRREPARRAEPPARTPEPLPEEPRPAPRPEPRAPAPELKRDAPPAREVAPPPAPAPAREPAPVRNAAPAAEAPALLRGEDQYLDETFLRGQTGPLRQEQTIEVERTPEPAPPPPPQSAPPPQPSPHAQPPSYQPSLHQPPPAPAYQSAPPPPVLIPPEAVRVLEEAQPAAHVGAAEEIYVTLLDDEGEFRAGQLATIKIRVGRGQFGQRAVADAAVTIKVLGTTFRPLILSTRTGADGVAVVRALLPRFTSGRAAIIIRASSGEEFAEMRRIIHQS